MTWQQNIAYIATLVTLSLGLDNLLGEVIPIGSREQSCQKKPLSSDNLLVIFCRFYGFLINNKNISA
jgi:hypothetical protein